MTQHLGTMMYGFIALHFRREICADLRVSCRCLEPFACTSLLAFVVLARNAKMRHIRCHFNADVTSHASMRCLLSTLLRIRGYKAYIVRLRESLLRFTLFEPTMSRSTSLGVIGDGRRLTPLDVQTA